MARVHAGGPLNSDGLADSGDDLVSGEPDSAEDPAVDAPAGEELGPRYTDCYEFFDEFLRNVIERLVNNEGSTPESAMGPTDWRRHPEILLGMQSLWEAWEGARISDAPMR